MKFKKITPEIEAISMVDVLYGFKHNCSLLPEWVKEAYDNYIITNVTDDSLYLDTIYGLVVANEEDYLLYENESIRVQKAEIFEQCYEKVVE